MDQLPDEAFLQTISRLGPIQLLRIRCVDQRMKFLPEKMLKGTKSLTIKHKFHAGIAVDDGKTHTVNNQPITVKDEMIMTSKVVKFCPNLQEK